MRYNQYSYTKASEEVMLDELARLGFNIQTTNSPKENLHHFLQKILHQQKNLPMEIIEEKHRYTV